MQSACFVWLSSGQKESAISSLLLRLKMGRWSAVLKEDVRSRSCPRTTGDDFVSACCLNGRPATCTGGCSRIGINIPVSFQPGAFSSFTNAAENGDRCFYHIYRLTAPQVLRFFGQHSLLPTRTAWRTLIKSNAVASIYVCVCVTVFDWITGILRDFSNFSSNLVLFFYNIFFLQAIFVVLYCSKACVWVLIIPGTMQRKAAESGALCL